MIRRSVILGIVFLVLFSLGWWVGRGAARADLYSNLDLFVEVLHKVEEGYVDPVDPKKLVDGALRSMLKQLDPYSQYLDAKAYKQLQSITQGSFGGIGIVVGVRDNYPTVISPMEGTPAWRAGLRSGDVIVEIDGKSSLGLGIEEVADRLRGPKGTKVRINVRREGVEAEQTFTLEREIIVTRAVPYQFLAEKGIGYLRLANFSEQSGEEVRSALESLREAGARSLVLDLRLNPGGLLDQAVDVAEQFLPKKALIVYTHGRKSSQDARYYARSAHAQLQWPLVVLVDNGSASAAEIVAGSLQDLDRALVVGRTTFGKGSVQSVFPLGDRSAALKLTTALYYTPTGRSIHHLVRDSTRDDDDDDDLPSAPSRPDSVPRPVFRTPSGRTVYGGGGVTPDVTIVPDSLPSLLRLAEARSLPFRFANRWLNGHPKGAAASASPDASLPWSEFKAFLREEKFAYEEPELAAERPQFERALKREFARHEGGDAAAARVVLEGDPAFRKAIQVLRKAKAPRDVFALASLPATEPRPGTGSSRAPAPHGSGAPAPRGGR